MQMLFEVPRQFVAQVASGQVDRFGAILKEVATGRIVGHLQETGAMQGALANALNPFAAPFSLISAGSSLAANVQLYRVDQKIERTIQMLSGLQTVGAVNVALAGLGLGVSVASFAYVKRRMDKIEHKLDGILAVTQRVLDEQRALELERLETDLDAQLDLAEEAWRHGDGGQRAWIRVADSLNDMIYKYPQHIARELESPEVMVDIRMLTYLLERYRLLAGTRIECLILTGELNAAHSFARKFSDNTAKLLQRVTPLTFVDRRSFASPDLNARLNHANELTMRIREFQDLSETKPWLISDLIDHKVDGREFVQQLAGEKSRALATVTF